MFQVEARDPETRRPLRYPDQNGWDIIETRDFRDIARELLPMSDQPVDLELRRSGRPSATLRCRDRVRFTDVSTDHYEAVRIEIRGQEPVLLGPEDFYGGRFTPGFVEAKFRQLDLRVGRVVWSAWEAVR